jgi:aryl-alcohol dehydrogenase-like predicted oxidoreductase
VYGLGHSEEVVGRFLREVPTADRPLVFTKCGLVWDEIDRMAEPRRNLRPESLRRECEASLRRLGIERIDLYQFHWPDDSGTAVEDSWGTMVRLVDEGKVRAIGVSNFTVALLERCEAVRHVDSLQPPFSAIRRDFAGELHDWCRTHATGVICYSPMQAGLLTDGFGLARIGAMPAEDWRRRYSLDFRLPKLEQNLALRDALRPIAARRGATVAALAVAWTLAWPAVTGAIVGARTPGQVDGWIRAPAIHLAPEDLDEIADAITRTRAGSGPLRPPR